jgi:hypothetical protein
MKFVDEQVIKFEVQEQYKPFALETNVQALPFTSLGDRNFEILVYQLLSRKLPPEINGENLKVELMEGVADRGRDVCLVNNAGNIIGIVQCKNWNEKITKPKLILEIIKTFLFFVLERETIFPQYYWIACPPGLTSPGKDLIRNMKNIIKEPIDEYFNQLVREYSSFETLSYDTIKENIFAYLNNLKVYEFTSVNLTEYLNKFNDVLSMHFKTISVIDIENHSRLLDEKFENYGLKLLTDEDLKILQERIGSIPEDARLRIMGIDFYGVYPDCIDLQKGIGYELYKALVHCKTLLYKMIAKKITDEATDRVFNEITIPLLMQGKIHQFSIEFAIQFILKSVLLFLQSNSTPEGILYDIKDKNKFFMEIEEEIKKDIIDSSSKVFDGDYSQLAGDEILVKFKIKVYKTHLFAGFDTFKSLLVKFNEDIIIMQGPMTKIINELLGRYSLNKTIIIHELNIWNSEQYMDQSLKTMKIFDNGLSAKL